jgi:hypothetical protein
MGSEELGSKVLTDERRERITLPTLAVESLEGEREQKKMLRAIFSGVAKLVTFSTFR